MRVARHPHTGAWPAHLLAARHPLAALVAFAAFAALAAKLSAGIEWEPEPPHAEAAAGRSRLGKSRCRQEPRRAEGGADHPDDGPPHAVVLLV